MTISLRGRMVLTYSLFICAFIALLSFVINRFASEQFLGFVSDSADAQSRQLAFSIAEQYSPETGIFDIAALRAVAMSYARQGFAVTVQAADGAVLWETGHMRGHAPAGAGMPAGEPGYGGGPERMLFWGQAPGRGAEASSGDGAGEGGAEALSWGHGRGPAWRLGMRGDPQMRGGEFGGEPPAHLAFPGYPGGRIRVRGRPGFGDGPRAQAFPITHGARNVGMVIVETSAPYFLDDNQFAFITALNRFLAWAGVAFALLSVAITALLAGALSRPILGAAGAAMRIAGGDWSARVCERHSTREIGELSRALNHLAATLEEGDRRQRRLSADVAHELRTPLATLQGSMEAMIDGVWEASPERLASCHEEITRLSRLAGDLGRLSILEGGPQALSLSRFDLGALLAGVVGQFEPAALEKGISIVLSAAGEFPVCADRDRLKQVFANLLSNAVKYTDSGGVSASEAAWGRYAVSVADTGIGIPPGELSLVFERFFRSDKSRSRATGGAGIGLAIAAAIASAHGGGIEAASGNGRGSVFTVFLPAAGGPP